MIKIPLEELSDTALQGVIDEFVMREGTDYGHRDYSLDEKRERVIGDLRAGRALITFDPKSGTTSVVIREDLV